MAQARATWPQAAKARRGQARRSGRRSRTRASGCRSRDNRMPTLHGQVQGAALRRQGRGRTTFFTELGVPTTFLLTSFYWDNFIYFGMGPKKGPDGKLAVHAADGRQEAPGIAAEDIGKCAYGIFKRGPRVHRQDGRHRRRAPDRRADGGRAHARRWARRCATTPCRPRSTAASASRAPTTSATCSSSSATSRRTSAARATSAVAAALNPALQTFDAVARREQGPHPARLDA